MTDEAEYTYSPPVDTERRRLVVQRYSEACRGWGNNRPATAEDVQTWAASHGLALVTAVDDLDTEEPGDSEALRLDTKPNPVRKQLLPNDAVTRCAHATMIDVGHALECIWCGFSVPKAKAAAVLRAEQAERERDEAQAIVSNVRQALDEAGWLKDSRDKRWSLAARVQTMNQDRVTLKADRTALLKVAREAYRADDPIGRIWKNIRDLPAHLRDEIRGES